MKKICVSAAVLVLLLGIYGSSSAETLAKGLTSRQIPSSVVQIFAQVNAAEPDAPWIGVGIESVNGSGVIIGGNRILTAAHGRRGESGGQKARVAKAVRGFGGPVRARM